MSDDLKEIIYWFNDEYPDETYQLLHYINNLQQRIDTALDYINLNFCNEDDGFIWHEDFKIIKDILKGVD